MELRGLHILVTGAAGFIGSHLAERLAPANRLRLVDDFSTGRRSHLAALAPLAGVEIVEADVRDAAAMRAASAGIDVVFHLAVSCLRTSLGDPFASHDVNAGGTLNLLCAAREQRVQRFVYVSSSEVYGSALTTPMAETHPCRPTTVYGASKLAGEQYALAFWRTWGMPVSVVRPFNTYGPREPASGARAEVIPRFAIRLLRGEAPVIFGSGRQTRDFSFVTDTARAIEAAGACDALVGDCVNVGSGRETSIAQIAELLRARVGRASEAPTHAGARPGDVDRHFADIARARELFGYRPSVELEAGLERTLAWFAEQRPDAAGESAEAARPNW